MENQDGFPFAFLDRIRVHIVKLTKMRGGRSMENKAIFEKLPSVLLPWYEANMRDLPWRKDRQPYHIWLSEIMLQQTRVEAVKGYYTRFLEQLPTIDALANADDGLLYKLWEGLGYYSRVRNLKKAAKQIMDQHEGVFPRKYEQILALPGIGTYTAGAICSIAYDMPTPAVDGNVLRVIARLTDDATPIDNASYKKVVRGELANIYPKQAGAFTQVLMELGATVCGPNRKPDCPNCPCNGFCLGYQNGTAETLPVKNGKKARRVEAYTVFVLSCDGYYALEKRPNKGLLAHQWQFPNIPGKLSVEQTVAIMEQMGLKPKEILLQVEKKHIFTHVEWDMCGVYVEVSEKDSRYVWYHSSDLERTVALPTAFRQFL